MVHQSCQPVVFRACLFILLCGLMVTQASAQVESGKTPRLHTPAEIMKIMEDSHLTYDIEIDSSIAPLDTPVVLSNQMYLREKPGGHSLEGLSLSAEAKQILDQAEEAFKADDYRKAITLYGRVIAVQPEYCYAQTLTGDAYFSLGQWDSAKACFLRSIDLNFADYDAHWFLADTYRKLGDDEAALKQGTIAYLLNVNHENLQKSVRFYRDRVHRPWKEWTFEPLYNLSKDGNRVAVKAAPGWITYAMVKAVWKYEPGYARSMLGGQKDQQVIVWPEEKEAIMAVVLGGEKFKNVSEMIERDFFTEFVLYELVAKKHPTVLVLLPREEFMKVVDYVNTFH